MKKKSSDKKATSAQRPEKKKPVARHRAKTDRNPGGNRGDQSARVKALKREGAIGAQSGAKPGERKVDVFQRPRVLKDLGGLFMLYEMGDGKIWACMSEALNEIYLSALRGHQKGARNMILQLERGLSLLPEIYSWEKMRVSEALGMRGSPVSNVALSDLAESLGEGIARVMKASDKLKAEVFADELLAMFKNALKGLVKEAGLTNGFKIGANSTGENFPREVVAIRFAKRFCEIYLRLPSKVEIRNALERKEVECVVPPYVTDRNIDAKWRELFDRAGLGSLQDVHPV